MNTKVALFLLTLLFLPSCGDEAGPSAKDYERSALSSPFLLTKADWLKLQLENEVHATLQNLGERWGYFVWVSEQDRSVEVTIMTNLAGEQLPQEQKDALTSTLDTHVKTVLERYSWSTNLKRKIIVQ